MTPNDRLEQFARRVAADPANLLFRFSLAQEQARRGLHAEALPHLEACRAGKPDWMMPRILLGEALLALGRRDAARPVLEEALALARSQGHEEPAEAVAKLLAGPGGD